MNRREFLKLAGCVTLATLVGCDVNSSSSVQEIPVNLEGAVFPDQYFGSFGTILSHTVENSHNTSHIFRYIFSSGIVNFRMSLIDADIMTSGLADNAVRNQSLRFVSNPPSGLKTELITLPFTQIDGEVWNGQTYVYQPRQLVIASDGNNVAHSFGGGSRPDGTRGVFTPSTYEFAADATYELSRDSLTIALVDGTVAATQSLITCSQSGWCQAQLLESFYDTLAQDGFTQAEVEVLRGWTPSAILTDQYAFITLPPLQVLRLLAAKYDRSAFSKTVLDSITLHSIPRVGSSNQFHTLTSTGGTVFKDEKMELLNGGRYAAEVLLAREGGDRSVMTLPLNCNKTEWEQRFKNMRVKTSNLDFAETSLNTTFDPVSQTAEMWSMHWLFTFYVDPGNGSQFEIWTTGAGTNSLDDFLQKIFMVHPNARVYFPEQGIEPVMQHYTSVDGWLASYGPYVTQKHYGSELEHHKKIGSFDARAVLLYAQLQSEHNSTISGPQLPD